MSGITTRPESNEVRPCFPLKYLFSFTYLQLDTYQQPLYILECYYSRKHPKRFKTVASNHLTCGQRCNVQCNHPRTTDHRVAISQYFCLPPLFTRDVTRPSVAFGFHSKLYSMIGLIDNRHIGYQSSSRNPVYKAGLLMTHNFVTTKKK